VIHHKDFDGSKSKLMVKVGMDTRAEVEKTGSRWDVMSSPEDLRADVEYALAQLGVDCLDIAVLCRVPLDAPIEVPIKGLSDLVKEGKIKEIGVSEASAENIRRAHKVHPLAVIETEYSLWSRDIEAEIIPTCRELGITVVAYSPLGRGFLTGTLRSRQDSAFSEHDFRIKMFPRMAENAFEGNLKLVDGLKPICESKGCTQGQLALAWLQSSARKFGVTIVPIPGTTKIEHLHSNLAARDITLTTEEEDAIESIFTPDIDAKVGDRYAHMTMCHSGAQVGGH
jgi:aryl-alcohol dehydrogenase-like predicted oxidoreductase